MQLYMRFNPKGHQTLLYSGLGKGSGHEVLYCVSGIINYDFDLKVPSGQAGRTVPFSVSRLPNSVFVSPRADLKNINS